MKRIEGRRRMAGGEGMGGGNPGAEPDNVEVIEIHHHYFHNRFGHMRAEECAFDSCLLLSGSQHCDRRWLTCCFCSQGVFLEMLHWKEISSAHSVVQKPYWQGLHRPAFLVNCPPHLLPRQELVFLYLSGESTHQAAQNSMMH